MTSLFVQSYENTFLEIKSTRNRLSFIIFKLVQIGNEVAVAFACIYMNKSDANYSSVS